MIALTPLYHWEPSERTRDILRDGLQSGPPHEGLDNEQPHVCFGADPVKAWELANVDRERAGHDSWDLWVAYLNDADDVSVRTDGPNIFEIMVEGIVPPTRLWWVGTRHSIAVEETPAQVEDRS